MATKLMSSAGGGITLDAASTATDKTLTLPARTGNVAVDGPAFSAYANSTQSISSATWTKVTLQAEDFDTNSNFDKDTNYRFTPNVAGYYQINAEVRCNGTSLTVFAAAIYKNGSPVSSGIIYVPSGVTAANQVACAKLIYFNGSSDYIELYGYALGTSPSFDYNSGGYFSRLNGLLVRAA